MKPPLPDHISSYYTNTRPEMLPFVPDGVGTHLDIGCGTGSWGWYLKQNGKVKESWGVELAEEPAAIASGLVDKVYAGDFFDQISNLPTGYFDLVTFNDVLEHFVDPWDVLRRVATLLSPHGRVLVSLPNVRHWDDLLRIVLDADFPYADQGIFDRTHMRFFTPISMRRLFDESSYEVERLEGISVPGIARHLNLYRLMRLFARARFEECRYLQFAVLARPR